jgi:hypothetical protein
MTYFPDIKLQFIEEMCVGQCVTVLFTATGLSIEMMASVDSFGDTLFVDELHISPNEASVREIGISGLREIANYIMEWGHYDCIIVQGASRTSGWNPKRRPNRLRFTRNRRDRYRARASQFPIN